MVHGNKTRVLLFGDSITLGAADIAGNEITSAISPTYVDDLRAALPECDFRVDAKLSRTTTQGVDELPAALDQHDPHIVVMMLGGNDGDMNWKRFLVTKGRVSRSNIQPVEYGRNLRTLAGMVLRRNRKVLLTDIPDFDLDTRTAYIGRLVGQELGGMLIDNGVHQLAAKGLQDSWHQAAQVSEALQVPLITYGRRLWEFPRSEMVGPDGVHPSAAAHRIIAREIGAALQSLIGTYQAAQSSESFPALRA